MEGKQPVTDIDQPKTDTVEWTDFLVRSALDFMAEMYPIADLHVSYRKKESTPGDPAEGRAQVTSEMPTAYQDVREVPARPGYLRVLDIALNGPISRFLGKSAGDKYLELVYDRISVAVELAETWTEQLCAFNHEETRKALQSALPVRLVAHLAADRFAQMAGTGTYRFAHHGEQNAHDTLASTLVQSLEYMDELARSRVEHQELSHGVIVAPQAAGSEAPASPGRYPHDFRPLKRTPLLANGYRTALRVAPDGQPIELLTQENLPMEEGDAPLSEFGGLTFLAAASKRYEGIGLMLRPGGSTVIFAGGRPLFIRRSGQWRGMIWDMIRNVMVERYGKAGTHIFDVVLILTTSGQGGILAVVEDGDPVTLNDKDRVDLARALGSHEAEQREWPGEWLLHCLLPEDNVSKMSPSVLALLASIDGATVIGEDGTLLAYGAIVPSVQSQFEGARTAAGRTLSENGLVFTISEDGPIQLFENGKLILMV